MLSTEDEKFIVYWEACRNNKTRIFRQFVIGLAIGLAIGVAVIVSTLSGWYKRATMIANAQFSPVIMLIAIAAISLFCAFFYKRYRWEMNEQHYQELLAKRKKQENNSQAAEFTRNGS
ncbi:hypothetical protein [Foetidibacter luteolus]|uniref:hypothetical protein n=1 Tax=Foetidibacter luteolus TaxID=2608880 RepID=UPI00129BD50E|nr:hypothetical protein [Foetidibacter luteolus]